MKKFNHYDLKLIQPNFDDTLTDLIIELDYLRRKTFSGSTHPQIFFQLKHIFHMLESIGSARIEGNHTTILEYIESKLDKAVTANEEILEIQNMESALNFIDDSIHDTPINRTFLSELHKMVVRDLSAEGSMSPGAFRQKNVTIAGAEFSPPDYIHVPDYMDELFDFINETHPAKYDLFKTAISHHRFVWIHPFDNGNGRTVRLLTYAMLIKSGFDIHVGRIINPTAIFCSDRSVYYHYLALADNGDRENILQWCRYVLSGFKKEIVKIEKLMDYNFVSKYLLIPAVRYAEERKYITNTERKILEIAVQKKVFQNADLTPIFLGKKKSEISRWIKRLKEKKLIDVEFHASRKYVINFTDNYILRGIIKSLGDNDFLPMKADE